MLSEENTRKAADILWELWRKGERTNELPPMYRPVTRAEGYAIQGLLEERSASALFGWKIAATSSAGQSHIGVGGPLAGSLLREQVYDDGSNVSLGNTAMRVVEPEFAFRMDCNLLPREHLYTVKEVIESVHSVHPALEIPDSRYENFATVGEAQLIADNACAHEFILGAPAPTLWRDIALELQPVEVSVGTRSVTSGVGSNVLSDPRVALTWLVNELSLMGISLKKDQIVTTGTAAIPSPINPGDTVSANFGSLGSVTVSFAL